MITDKATAAKYLSASEEYLADPRHYKSMVFSDWPDLSPACPLCGSSDCAIYRGYYQRRLYCPELEYFGPVVIRTGYCKSKRVRFTLFPDFLMPHKRISFFSFRRLIECFKEQNHQLQQAIDQLLSDLGDEFYLPLSTAYSYLLIQSLPP